MSKPTLGDVLARTRTGEPLADVLEDLGLAADQADRIQDMVAQMARSTIETPTSLSRQSSMSHSRFISVRDRSGRRVNSRFTLNSRSTARVPAIRSASSPSRAAETQSR